MLEDSLRAATASLPPGWSAHLFERVESTQDLARAAARTGAPDRSIFVADEQTAGRGRQRRHWMARPGSGLLLSILFRERSVTPLPWRYTSLASLALIEAIERLLPELRPAIKWPNDVVLGRCKVAGVLAESASDGEQLLVVVGVGVNVASSADELITVGGRATSLALAVGRPVDRGALLRLFVDRLDAWLARSLDEARAAWQARLWGRGQRLRLADPDRVQDVVVLGADADGALRVRLPDGSERRTTTGELIL